MKYKLIALLVAAFVVGSSFAGVIYGPTKFMDDVTVGSWVEMSNMTWGATQGGTYTNQILYTNYYRLSGTNAKGRIGLSSNILVIFNGNTNATATNAVILHWPAYRGVMNYVLEWSHDEGVTWTNWVEISPSLTNFTDYGTNTFSGIHTNYYTNLFSQAPDPVVPWLSGTAANAWLESNNTWTASNTFSGTSVFYGPVMVQDPSLTNSPVTLKRLSEATNGIPDAITGLNTSNDQFNAAITGLNTSNDQFNAAITGLNSSNAPPLNTVLGYGAGFDTTMVISNEHGWMVAGDTTNDNVYMTAGPIAAITGKKGARMAMYSPGGVSGVNHGDFLIECGRYPHGKFRVFVAVADEALNVETNGDLNLMGNVLTNSRVIYVNDTNVMEYVASLLTSLSYAHLTNSAQQTQIGNLFLTNSLALLTDGSRSPSANMDWNNKKLLDVSVLVQGTNGNPTGADALFSAASIDVMFQEEGYTDGERNWAFNVNNGAFNLQALNDGFSGGANFLSFYRSGFTNTYVDWHNATLTNIGRAYAGTVTVYSVSGHVMTGDLEMGDNRINNAKSITVGTNALPTNAELALVGGVCDLDIREEDASAHHGNWRFRVNGSQLALQSVDDDWTTGQNMLSFARDGYTNTYADFNNHVVTNIGQAYIGTGEVARVKFHGFPNTYFYATSSNITFVINGTNIFMDPN